MGGVATGRGALMARRALGGASLRVVRAVGRSWPASGATVTRIRLGVSGGADSMALAAGVAHVLARRPYAGSPPVDTAVVDTAVVDTAVVDTELVDALVVDHGLFPGSAEHSASVAARLRALGLEARVAQVSVERTGSLEDAARRARHHALWTHPRLDGSLPTQVWLAHTLDDQAEGVLLGLARGSGARSLSGMAPRRTHHPATDAGGISTGGEVVRPLLGLRRRDTEQACSEWGLEVWHDPANTDARFRRSALRPALASLSDVLGTDLAVNLARTADLLRDDADLLDALAADAQARVAAGDALDVAGLEHLPVALRSRVVHQWLARCSGAPAGRGAVLRVLELVDDWHGQGPLHLPGDIAVSRRGPLLVAEPRRRRD